MTRIKIANYIVTKGRGYWQAKPAMRALGFQSTPCGPDGPEAWAKAEALNVAWRKARVGLPTSRATKTWPTGSVGEALQRFRRTRTWALKEPRTREDWDRRWKFIEPVFGDMDPLTIGFEDLDAWYWQLVERKGVHEAFHSMKVWRALWRVMASLGYCRAVEDPSLAIRRLTPKGRSAVWHEGEAVRFVKGAIRHGYHGLACCVAVAWDTSFSPVDVRQLSPDQMAEKDGRLRFTSVNREKTDAEVIGTLSRRTERLVRAYLGDVHVLPGVPLFRNRGLRAPPAPYSKDTLGDDFREVRLLVFGPEEDRKLMDMRRSGAVEASDGHVEMRDLAAKMGNTIDRSAALQKTYIPVSEASVRGADEARRVGRRRARNDR